MDLFLDAHEHAPARLVLNLDATDDPLHGRQEGRFFHGYYDCCCCYLPLYVFCGDHLLRRSDIDASAGATEEVERIVGQIRARWPAVEIVLRADVGFPREPLMAWCEDNNVDYVFALARNARLVARLQPALDRAGARSRENDRPARLFTQFCYRTLKTWSRPRRVVSKAEWVCLGCPHVKHDRTGTYSRPSWCLPRSCRRHAKGGLGLSETCHHGGENCEGPPTLPVRTVAGQPAKIFAEGSNGVSGWHQVAGGAGIRAQFHPTPSRRFKGRTTLSRDRDYEGGSTQL